MELHIITAFILLLSFHTSITSSSPTCGRIHEVQKGETCLSISHASNLSLKEFLNLNQHLNCSKLKINKPVCTSPCMRRKELHHKRRTVLMDYIGAMGTPIQFSDVPVSEEIDQYFILSFAIDANDYGVVQNGNFISYWSESLTPESVLEIKSKHKHVKVMLSLAGYSLDIKNSTDPMIVRWYDPSDPHRWIKNAVKSLSALIKKYHLDGIDIDYESMQQNQTKNFAFCVGEVVKELKSRKLISVATIAPYGESSPYYKPLVRNYGRLFDYINFQFYSYDNVTTSKEYVKLYKTIVKGFDKHKVLVSLEVDGRGVSSAEFFDAVNILRKKYWIPGMFLWSAEGSKHDGFIVEKVAQCMLP